MTDDPQPETRAVDEPDPSRSAAAPAEDIGVTPLTAGPPRLFSLVSTAAAALILLVAIVITVLSWPDWLRDTFRGEKATPAETRPADESPS